MANLIFLLRALQLGQYNIVGSGVSSLNLHSCSGLVLRFDLDRMRTGPLGTEIGFVQVHIFIHFALFEKLSRGGTHRTANVPVSRDLVSGDVESCGA